MVILGFCLKMRHQCEQKSCAGFCAALQNPVFASLAEFKACLFHIIANKTRTLRGNPKIRSLAESFWSVFRQSPKFHRTDYLPY